MKPSPGNDGAARGPAAVPLIERVDQLEQYHVALVRLLTDRGVLPRVVEESVQPSPGLTITSNGATLAGTTGAVGLALGALST